MTPDKFDKADPFDAVVIQFVEVCARYKRDLIAAKRDAGEISCPRCGDRVHVRLAGPKLHLHAACAGCNYKLME